MTRVDAKNAHAGEAVRPVRPKLARHNDAAKAMDYVLKRWSACKRRGGDTSQFDWLRGAFVDQDGWRRRRLTRCF